VQVVLRHLEVTVGAPPPPPSLGKVTNYLAVEEKGALPTTAARASWFNPRAVAADTLGVSAPAIHLVVLLGEVRKHLDRDLHAAIQHSVSGSGLPRVWCPSPALCANGRARASGYPCMCVYVRLRPRQCCSGEVWGFFGSPSLPPPARSLPPSLPLPLSFLR
jgi:hypothetical protein